MGVLQQKHITPIQKWALSYYIIEKKNIAVDKQDAWWKQYLLITNRPMFDAVYAEEISESSEIDDTAEQGLDDPDEIESILREMSGQLSIVDSRLPANNGEWS